MSGAVLQKLAPAGLLADLDHVDGIRCEVVFEMQAGDLDGLRLRRYRIRMGDAVGCIGCLAAQRDQRSAGRLLSAFETYRERLRGGIRVYDFDEEFVTRRIACG